MPSTSTALRFDDWLLALDVSKDTQIIQELSCELLGVLLGLRYLSYRIGGLPPGKDALWSVFRPIAGCSRCRFERRFWPKLSRFFEPFGNVLIFPGDELSTEKGTIQ
jgi:hypothetical protein